MWADFVRRHAATRWAADFVGVKAWTALGLIDLYVLVFANVGTRRAFASGVTALPDEAWVTQQARNASMRFAELGLPARQLLIDHDAKFVRAFDAVMAADGTRVKRVGPRAPNRNAFAERFIQALGVERLDHYAIMGERHLRHLLTEFLAHYNGERPHQGVGNVPLTDAGPDPPDALPFPTAVACRTRLGGLLSVVSVLI